MKKRKKKLLIVGTILGITIWLVRKNRELEKTTYNLQGQVENQKYIIKGMQRTIERTSFINGKYARRINN